MATAVTPTRTRADVSPYQRDPTPTYIERMLYGALTALGVRYEQQVVFGVYTVDAYLPGPHVALEADGCATHYCPLCGWDHWQPPEAAQRAARRQATLRCRYLLPVVHVWGHDLATPSAALAAVQTALAGCRPSLYQARKELAS